MTNLYSTYTPPILSDKIFAATKLCKENVDLLSNRELYNKFKSAKYF